MLYGLSNQHASVRYAPIYLMPMTLRLGVIACGEVLGNRGLGMAVCLDIYFRNVRPSDTYSTAELPLLFSNAQLNSSSQTLCISRSPAIRYRRDMAFCLRCGLSELPQRMFFDFCFSKTTEPAVGYQLFPLRPCMLSSAII